MNFSDERPGGYKFRWMMALFLPRYPPGASVLAMRFFRLVFLIVSGSALLADVTQPSAWAPTTLLDITYLAPLGCFIYFTFAFAFSFTVPWMDASSGFLDMPWEARVLWFMRTEGLVSIIVAGVFLTNYVGPVRDRHAIMLWLTLSCMMIDLVLSPIYLPYEHVAFTLCVFTGYLFVALMVQFIGFGVLHSWMLNPVSDFVLVALACFIHLVFAGMDRILQKVTAYRMLVRIPAQMGLAGLAGMNEASV